MKRSVLLLLLGCAALGMYRQPDVHSQDGVPLLCFCCVAAELDTIQCSFLKPIDCGNTYRCCGNQG
jgi:hypothetical protein